MAPRKPNHDKSRIKIHDSTIVNSTSGVEEYKPSNNADKYTIEAPKYSYRVLSYSNDYIKLQEEVTKLLNDGWTLAGGVSVSIHANQYSGTTVFSQSVYRLA
jgi:hypothetical protein